jgi:hypothetical protein
VGTVQEQQDGAIGYEPALRVIGRHLDAEPAYHVRVVEEADGFTVRSHPSIDRTDERRTHYSWDRLHDLVVYQTAGRGVRRRRSRHSGLWENFPNGHEDFFRALGHELDQENASNLSVDEVEEGVAVSYTRPSENDPDRPDTVHRMMQRADIEAMLRAAQARRRPQVAPS